MLGKYQNPKGRMYSFYQLDVPYPPPNSDTHTSFRPLRKNIAPMKTRVPYESLIDSAGEEETLKLLFGPYVRFQKLTEQGQYSTTYVAPEITRDQIASLSSDAVLPKNKVFPVFIKLQTSIRNGIREACVLDHLMKSKTQHCGPFHALDPKTYVPRLYFYGKIGAYYVIVSEYIQNGIPLSNFHKNTPKPVRLEIGQQLERAVISLWMCGVVHNDLHEKNVIVSTKNKRIRVYIIDFGFAIKLHKDRAKLLKERVCIDRNFDGALNDTMRKYIYYHQSYLAGRNGFHTNTDVLRRFKALTDS